MKDGDYGMFVYNVKMNKNSIKIVVIILVILILLSIFAFVGYRFFNSISMVTVKDEMGNLNDCKIEINSNNYTNILKDSHDNIDKYVGKTIKGTGFIYRIYDFNENQFVLGRNMIISSDNKSVVVGFLCDGSSSGVNVHSIANSSWVEIEGIIVKGNYHGDMPIIEVKNIKEADAPSDEFVYPPDDTYVSTD